MDGEVQGAVSAAPTTAATSPPLAWHGLSVVERYLERLLIVVTVIALGVLVLISWQVHDAGEHFEMMWMGLPVFAMGVGWLVTFVSAVWMVRIEVSGASLALIVVGLGTVGYVLGRAVPPESVDDRIGVMPGLSHLALELQFSLVSAAVVLVLWAVWASMPVARRFGPRSAIAGLGVGILVLLVLAWRAVPSYPPVFFD